MEYSTLKPWQEISESEVIYDVGSLYARFQKISDPRKAQGKRYSLTTLLVIIFWQSCVEKTGRWRSPIGPRTRPKSWPNR
jgi:hypothetical protein